MPIYTYKCKKCGKEFDWMQSINSEPLTVCPAEICEQNSHGRGEVERVFSPNVGLIFKGTGFYLTDYTKKNSSSTKNGHTSNGNNNNGQKAATNPQNDNKTTSKTEQS